MAVIRNFAKFRARLTRSGDLFSIGKRSVTSMPCANKLRRRKTRGSQMRRNAPAQDRSSRTALRLPRSLSRRDACRGISAFAGMAVASKNAFAQTSGDIAVWNIDNLDSIGGNPTHVDGQPKVIATPAGKAVAFDGVHDGLFVDKHPLAGFSQFTFEALVRPDGGEQAQRWFHLAETDPRTGLDATTDPNNPTADKNSRFTFELRVDGDRCYFESFTHGPGYQSALIDKTKTHPLGQWYVVTQTYDG